LVRGKREIGRHVTYVEHGHEQRRIRWTRSWPAMIVLDCATGTELGRGGVDTRGTLFSAAALLSEQGIAVLRALHAAYVLAGAQVIRAKPLRNHPREPGGRWRELMELA